MLSDQKTYYGLTANACKHEYAPPLAILEAAVLDTPKYKYIQSQLGAREAVTGVAMSERISSRAVSRLNADRKTGSMLCRQTRHVVLWSHPLRCRAVPGIVWQ